MLKVIIFCALCLNAAFLGAKEAPDWFTPLRDAVYAQKLNADEIAFLYRDAVKNAGKYLTGSELYTMLSRCEYMMGRVYQEDGRKDDAIRCYERGVEWAEKANAETPSADAYEMLASNIGQQCMLRSIPWVMANGLKVEENAKKGLKIDGRHAACMYMIASRWAFGPRPFGNPRRGVNELSAILNGIADLGQDDYFNVYSGVSYAYLRLKKKVEAAAWAARALEIYPTNKFALGLLQESEN
jgi:tetratricopeptide (TPR) repeat protein